MHENSAKEQDWELLTVGTVTRKLTTQGKAINIIKLDPPEALGGDDNKWKNPQRFDR